ncbi:MAG: hypothetical protein ACLFSL_04575 [Candidatus Woesearchaeota archaeon]
MYYDAGIIHELDGYLTTRYERCLQNIGEARRIVMKFGTDAVNSIFDGYGESLVEDIGREYDIGKEFLIVSSGAIGMGKSSSSIEDPDPVIRKSVYASLGQPILMDRWLNLLATEDLTGTQVLYENENLTGNSRHKEYIKQGLESMLGNGILPIVNENDAVTSEEITTSGKAKTFGDNDNLARLVCDLIDADLMIFFTGAGGVYDDITDKNSLYEAIFDQDEEFYMGFIDSVSPDGEGGIRSKLEASSRLAEKGIPVVITSPERENPLNCSLYKHGNHTVIVPQYH